MRIGSRLNLPQMLTLIMEHMQACVVILLLTFVRGCPDGYYGQTCNSACRYPNYGKFCQMKCNCTEDICNHINGCMNIPKECEDGFYAYDCYSPCRYPSYGRQCQKECNCSISKCNHINGCQGNQSTLDVKPLLEYQLVIIITGSSALLFLLALIVSVILIKKYRSNRTNNNQDVNFDSEFSSYDYDNENIEQRTSVRYCDNRAVIGNCKLETYENIHL